MATKRSKPTDDETQAQIEAEAKAAEGKDAALPDSVDDRTNIGERNTAGQESNLKVMPDDERVMPPPPVAASEYDKALPEPQGNPDPSVVEPDTDLITVKGMRDDGVIAFAEVNVRHPGGQAVVIGSESVDVAQTFRVMTAIRDGQLEQA